jgi:hypothetical protein
VTPTVNQTTLLAAPAEVAAAARLVAAEAIVCVPETVAPGACARLLREVEGAPFVAEPEATGPVQQRLDTLELGDELGAYPAIRELRDELAALVQQHAPLRDWRPNDASVLRYRPGEAIGITPHLDGRRYGLVVAVVTIAGRARVSRHETREGPPVQTWTIEPGTLMLVRGPGLTGPDERPFHSVSGPLGDGPRYSIGYRLDTTRTS